MKRLLQTEFRLIVYIFYYMMFGISLVILFFAFSETFLYKLLYTLVTVPTLFVLGIFFLTKGEKFLQYMQNQGDLPTLKGKSNKQMSMQAGVIAIMASVVIFIQMLHKF